MKKIQTSYTLGGYVNWCILKKQWNTATCSMQWMDLESIMLSEIRQIEKPSYYIIHMWNLKNSTNEYIYTKYKWAHGEQASVQFSSVTQSCLTLWSHGLQHTRPPCPSPTPGVYSNSRLLIQWCHPNISSSVVPSPPAFNLSQHQDLFKWVSSSHQVAKLLEFLLQLQSFQWIFRTDFL